MQEEGSGLEDSVSRLSLGGDVTAPAYPERPGEPGCNYYIRTGRCDFGESCRFDHPRNRTAVATASAIMDYPERAGQPVCQYFLKTGSCKFGLTCKFHHPKRETTVNPVQLNIYGYPMRKGEKECNYYLKNGNCKFGATCKFHHPQPELTSATEHGQPFYPSIVSPYHLPTVVNGQEALTLPIGPYGPVLIPSEMLPFPGWNPYMHPVGQVCDEDGVIYGVSNQVPPPVPIFQNQSLLPERPGQPECQHYVKTGQCKFGYTCKFHHPSERISAKASYFLNPVGLPLRPGAPHCIFFAQHGVCKFGPSCKFDHPMKTLTYNPSSSSSSSSLSSSSSSLSPIIDMPPLPFPTPAITLSPLSLSFTPATLSLSTAQAQVSLSITSSNTCNGTDGEDAASGVETQ